MMMRAKHRGFTLIEVLAALVIVSIGMMAVIQAVSQAASNGSYLRDKTVAQWVAMNQLTTMRLAQSPPAKGTSSGESEMVGQRWHWTAEVQQTAIDSMKRVDIAVRLSDSDENSQLATVTGFLGDKLAKPGVLIEQFTPVPGTSRGVNPPGSQGQTPQTPGSPNNPTLPPGTQPIAPPTSPVNPPPKPPLTE